MHRARRRVIHFSNASSYNLPKYVIRAGMPVQALSVYTGTRLGKCIERMLLRKRAT